MTNTIDERHRKELLKFLLVKTAAVRRGVKPAELLRVRHCYSTVNAEGLRVCLYRSDIYSILGLDYIELKVEERSSLVLFYNPPTLNATLKKRSNRLWLAGLGYPVDGTMHDMLSELCHRAGESALPHEVGVFIGYPLKDVAGFMQRIPATPVHGCAWRIYGDASVSMEKMHLYKNVELDATAALECARSVDDFIEMISLERAS